MSLEEIRATQLNLEDCFTKRMAELESQLHSGGPAKDTVAKVVEEFRTFRESMFSMLTLLRKQINECSTMVDDMETRHRRKALIFLGVTEVDKEDCTTAILSVVHKMQLKDITAADISSCHRIGGRTRNRHRPILVRFTGVSTRSIVWRNKTKLKGSAVTVKEFLTKTRQSIFIRARQHFGMRGCWTQDGIIVAKAADGTKHKFTTVDQLNAVVQKQSVPSSAGRGGADNVVSVVNTKQRK